MTAIIWTVVFFGGVVLILFLLLFKAIQADRADARQAQDSPRDGE